MGGYKRKSIVQGYLDDKFGCLGYYAHYKAEYGVVWVYEKDTPRGMDYIGEASVLLLPDMKVDGYEYGGDVYHDIRDMVNAMCESNKELFFPSYTYDPMYHNMAKVRTKVNWYMRNVLKFSIPTWDEYPALFEGDVYVMRNMYNEIISSICISYNDEFGDPNAEITGTVFRSVSRSLAIISHDFKSVEECIAGINGLIEPEYLTDIVNKLEVVSSMTAERNYNADLLSVDKHFNVHKCNIKNATKKLLQDALARLDEE